MNEYRMKDSIGYQSRSYVEPSVSYFDSILEAGEKTVSVLASTAAAVALALLSALTTSMRGYENSLEE
jgi:hypothetical protein